MKELKQNSIFRDYGYTHIEKKGNEIYLYSKKGIDKLTPLDPEEFLNSEV